MFYMKKYSFFILFILFSALFVQAEVEWWPFLITSDISELEMRMRFLKECPKSFSEMINYDGMENGKIVKGGESTTFASNAYQRGALVDKNNSVWSNRNGTINFGVGSTGNSFLDVLPPPARAVVIVVKFLKNFTHNGPYRAWINNFFGVRPLMTFEACLCIIQKDPYVEKIFFRVQDIKNYINEVNSTDIVIRILARINLLEVELPPPYDRKFKKAIKKFKKQCTNAKGDLVGNQEIIKVFTIFNSYLKEMLIIPEIFIKRIPKLKKYKHYTPKSYMNSKFHHDIVQFIADEPKMSFPRLMSFCKKHGGRIIAELYNHFVKKRIEQAQQQIKKDPQWNEDQNNGSLEQQAKLLLRSYYQKELEDWVSCEKIDGEDIEDETYHALDRVKLTNALPEGYHFELLNNFIQNICKGIDNCSIEIVQTFFHISGVLKKYETNDFVQKYILNKKLISPQLHKAVNYALAIQDKIDTEVLKIACIEILLNSIIALNSVDFEIVKKYEKKAYDLYHEIVDKKGMLTLKEVNADLVKDFENLIIDK